MRSITRRQQTNDGVALRQRSAAPRGKEAGMGWLIGLGVAVAIGVSGFLGVQSGLDRKAKKMAKGSDEDRQLAAELRDVSRKIDQGKYLYP